MAYSVYLEGTLEDLKTLPENIQRNFSAIRELDTRVQKLMGDIDLLSECYLKNVKTFLPEEQIKYKEKIQKMYDRAKAYSEDKLQVAKKTYEMVDGHVRNLDEDLARFEVELCEKLNLEDSDASECSVKRKRKLRKNKRRKKLESQSDSADEELPEFVKKRFTAQINKAKINTLSSIMNGEKADVMEMPVDPHEPTYCHCNQVSYGAMIQCDNLECPYEWFHFPCVGLESTPQGSWYCPACLGKKIGT